MGVLGECQWVWLIHRNPKMLSRGSPYMHQAWCLDPVRQFHNGTSFIHKKNEKRQVILFAESFLTMTINEPSLLELLYLLPLLPMGKKLKLGGAVTLLLRSWHCIKQYLVYDIISQTRLARWSFVLLNLTSKTENILILHQGKVYEKLWLKKQNFGT